jgi:redox-sensing transcriptional repressor
MIRLSSRAVERLIVYRRLLAMRSGGQLRYIYSHEIAGLAHVSAVQVRRDLMEAGFSGSPSRGYDVGELLSGIDTILDAPEGTKAVLVGVGNIGRAVLSFLSGRGLKVEVVAAFDNDPAKIERVISGCRVYDVQTLNERVRELGAHIGVIAVPGPQAQAAADALVEVGVTGIVNFAPVPLVVQAGVAIEQVDIMRALEKVAHFAKQEKAREVEAIWKTLPLRK